MTAGVVVPVDLRGVSAVEDVGAAGLGEAVPGPIDERLDLGPRTGHQAGVDAEPGHVRELAVDLVVALADLGDRRAAADHGHDPLVVVAEVLAALAVEAGDDVVRRPRAALERDRSELGQRLVVGTGDVGDVADEVDAGAAGEGQVGLDVDASAPSLGEAAVGGDRRRLDATAPDHAAGRQDGAVREHGVAGRDLLDAGAEVDLDPFLVEDLGDVVVGTRRERLEQRVAEVEQADPRLRRVEVAVLARDGDLDHVAERAGDLDAGRAPADHDDVERAAVDQRRIAVDLLEQPEDAGAQPGRVVERIEGERVLRGARSSEEVRLRARGSTSASPVHDSPSWVVTVRFAVSTPVISARCTSTLSWSANTSRSECAMSVPASCEVATW